MNRPFTSDLHRLSIRRVGLFIATMAVPCVVLLALGVQTVVQQEELAVKHAADDRRLRLNEFEKALVTALDRVRDRPHDSSVAIVGTLSDNGVVWPWDTVARPSAASSARFEAALADAETAEFSNLGGALAERAAQSAVSAAANAVEKCRARLVLARIFTKAGRGADAEQVYLTLLGEPVSTVDSLGTPFALYAAEWLASAESRRHAASIGAVVASAIKREWSLPPVAWYLARSVHRADGAGDASLGRTIAQRIADVEQALALQRDFVTIAGVWRASDAAWAVFGSPRWLVGIDHPGGEPRRLLSVRLDPVVDAIHRTSADLAAVTVAPAGAGDEWLGDAFPGVKARISIIRPASGPLWMQRGFYAVALAIVFGVTSFSGFLLWRDVQRDIRLAALRSQFVSSVSHELRTPLTAIRLFADALRSDQISASARHEYVDTIVNESERLTRLLNNVLDFSQIEQGGKAYRFEARSLGDVVRVAARAMAYPLEQHGFTLHLDIDDSLPPAPVDGDALQQAILNLLTNAMKYSGTGRDIDLRLAPGAAHGDAIISVVDRGTGIPHHEQVRIFEKFYRVGTPENQRIPGAGLGLTLVDHIVRAHGGSIRVDSTPGLGSTFSIHLPGTAT